MSNSTRATRTGMPLPNDGTQERAVVAINPRTGVPIHPHARLLNRVVVGGRKGRAVRNYHGALAAARAVRDAAPQNPMQEDKA